MQFYPLVIKQITPETADAVTLDFDIPADLAELFRYKPGQYVTLRLPGAEPEVRRSYSMSSSPAENRLAVTVKKVPGGKASTYLHDQLKSGDSLEVAPPEGRFYPKLSPEQRRTYYLFGSGSGITPLMSIAKSVLEQEPMSAVFLLYGSRDEENIIFKDALEKLSTRYEGQLFIEHVLSKPKKETVGAGLFGLFKKTATNWNGRTGRINAKTVADFMDEHPPHGPETDSRYFICGPGDMPDTVKAALLIRGAASDQVFVEHFVSATHVPGDIAAGKGGKRVAVTLKGDRFHIQVPEGATILDVLVKEKYDPPYSCTAGACSTCMAKVVSGSVKMEACYALDDAEVQAGFCLTCQAKPETELTEITFDL